MADNIAITAGAGTNVATDDIGGVHHQRVKVTWGPDATANDTDVATGKPLPVQERVSDGTAYTFGAGAVAAGTQRVTHASDDPVTTAIQIIDDWDESDRAKVNPIVGQAGVAANSGTVSASTQRVVLASDVGLPAGTNLIGQIRTPLQFVTVDFAVQTTANDVGDVIADTQVVATCTPANDALAILHSVTLIDVDDQKAKLRIVLFKSNTALGTEDAAPDIDDTEIQEVIGHIDINIADYIDLGTGSYAHKSGLGIVVKPATGTDDIYAAIYSPDTSTPTYATGHIYVHFGFI